MAIQNALTIDVEDYFHVSAFAKTINHQDWDNCSLRVEKNTHRLANTHTLSQTFFLHTHLSLPKLPIQLNLTNPLFSLFIQLFIILHQFFTLHNLIMTTSQQIGITRQKHLGQAPNKSRLIKALRLRVEFGTS